MSNKPDSCDAKVSEKLKELKSYIPFLERLIKTLKEKQNLEGKIANPTQLHNIETLYNIISAKGKKSHIGLDTLVKCETLLIKIYGKIEKTSSITSDKTNPSTESSAKDKLSEKAKCSVEAEYSTKTFKMAGELQELDTNLKSKTDASKNPLTMQFISKPKETKNYNYTNRNYRDATSNNYYEKTFIEKECKPSTSTSNRLINEKNSKCEATYYKAKSQDRNYERSNTQTSRCSRSKSRETNYNRSDSRENSVLRARKYDRSKSITKKDVGYSRSKSRDVYERQYSRERSISKDRSLSRSGRHSRHRSNDKSIYEGSRHRDISCDNLSLNSVPKKSKFYDKEHSGRSNDIRYYRSKSRETNYNRSLSRGRSTCSMSNEDYQHVRSKSKNKTLEFKEYSRDRHSLIKKVYTEKNGNKMKSDSLNSKNLTNPEQEFKDISNVTLLTVKHKIESKTPKPLLASDEPDWDIDENDDEVKCFQAYPLDLDRSSHNLNKKDNYKPILIISDSESSDWDPKSPSNKKSEMNINECIFSDISDGDDDNELKSIDSSLLPIESTEWERKSLMQKSMLVNKNYNTEQKQQNSKLSQNAVPGTNDKKYKQPQPYLVTDIEEDWDDDTNSNNNDLITKNSKKNSPSSRNEEPSKQNILQPPPEIPEFFKQILDNVEEKISKPSSSIFERLGNKFDFEKNLRIHVKNDVVNKNKVTEISSRNVELELRFSPKVLRKSDEQTLPPPPDISLQRVLPPPPQINFNLNESRLAYKYNPHPRKTAVVSTQVDCKGVSSGTNDLNTSSNIYKPIESRVNQQNSNLIQSKTDSLLSESINILKNSTNIKEFEKQPNMELMNAQFTVTSQPKTYGEYRRRTKEEREHQVLTNKTFPKNATETNKNKSKESSLEECKSMTNNNNIQVNPFIGAEHNYANKNLKGVKTQDFAQKGVDKILDNSKFENHIKEDCSKKTSSNIRKESLKLPSSSETSDKNKNGKNKIISNPADKNNQKQTTLNSEKQSRLDSMYRSSDYNTKSSTSVSSFKIPKKNANEQNTSLIKNQISTVSKLAQPLSTKADKEFDKSSQEIYDNHDRNKQIEDKLAENASISKNSVEQISHCNKGVERVSRDPRLQCSKLIKSNTLELNVAEITLESRRLNINADKNPDTVILNTVVNSDERDGKLLENNDKIIAQPIRKRRKSIFDATTDNTEVSTQNIVEGKRKTRTVLNMNENTIISLKNNSEVSKKLVESDIDHLNPSRKDSQLKKDRQAQISVGSSPKKNNTDSSMENRGKETNNRSKQQNQNTFYLEEVGVENDTLAKRQVQSSLLSQGKKKANISTADCADKSINLTKQEEESTSCSETIIADDSTLNKINVLGMLSKILDKKKFGQIKKIIENDDADEQTSLNSEVKKNHEKNNLSPSTEKRKTYKTELDRLNEDVRDMFISKDVLMATGKRMCSSTIKVNVESDKIKSEIILNEQNNTKQVFNKKKSSSNEKAYALKKCKVILTRCNLNDLKTIVPKKKIKRRLDWARGNIKRKKNKNSNLLNASKKIKITFKKFAPIKPQSSKCSTIIKRSNLQNAHENCRPCPKSKKSLQNLHEVDSSISLDSILKEKTFDSTLKNIYSEIHSKSSYAKNCVLCEYKGDLITNHYILNHTKCEVYTSRLPADKVADISEDKNNVPAYCFREQKVFCYLYQCPFCDVELTLNRKGWIAHFATHTGEYLFKCTNCGLVMNEKSDLQKHKKESCPKGEIVANNYYGKNMKAVQGLLCEICNFVQMVQLNMLNHLKVQHNVRSSSYKIFNLINMDNVPKIEKNNTNIQLEKEEMSLNENESNRDELAKTNKVESTIQKEIEINDYAKAPSKSNISKRKVSNKAHDSSPKRLKVSDDSTDEKDRDDICDNLNTSLNNKNIIINTLQPSNDDANEKVLVESVLDNLSQNFKTPNKVNTTNNSQQNSESRGVMIIDCFNKQTEHNNPSNNIDVNNCSSSIDSLVIDESYESERNTDTDAEPRSRKILNDSKRQEKPSCEDADDDEWEDIEILSTNTTASVNSTTTTTSNPVNMKEKKSKTILQKLSKLYAALTPKSNIPKTKKIIDTSILTNENEKKSHGSIHQDKSSVATLFLAEPLNDLNDISNLLESTDLDSMEIDENICNTIDVLGLGSVDLTETDDYLVGKYSEDTEAIEYRINNVGFRVLANEPVKYVCLVPECTFLFTEQKLGIQSHFLLDHSDLRWNGFCYICEKKICSDITKMSIVKEFDHMEHHYVQTVKFNNSNKNEKIVKPRITVRRLSGDLLSTVISNTDVNTTQNESVKNIETFNNSINNSLINDVQKNTVSNFAIPRVPNLKTMQVNSSNLKSLLATPSRPPLSLNSTKSMLPNILNNNNQKTYGTTQSSEGVENVQNNPSTSNIPQIVSVSGGITIGNNITLKNSTESSAKNVESTTVYQAPSHRTTFTVISKPQLKTKQTNEQMIAPNIQILNVRSLSNTEDSVMTNPIIKTTAPSINAICPNPNNNILQIQNVCSLTEQKKSLLAKAGSNENATKKNLKPWCDIISTKPFEISKLQLRPISLFAKYKCMSFNCFFTTENEDKLMKHFALHTCSRSEIPNDWFECSYCNFRASNNQDFFSHFTKYHKNDVFQCPYCFYRSCNDFCVIKHIEFFHSNIKNKQIYVGLGEKRQLADDIKMLAENRIRYVTGIKCFDCDKEFFIIQNFLNHIIGIHRVKCFTCYLCLKCIDIANAIKHFLKEHVFSNYQCIYCTFASFTREKIIQHLVNKHPSNLMYACYRICPIKNTPISSETVENSTVIENLIALVKNTCLRICAFEVDELNFMSPSLDPKSIKDNKNATPNILHKTNNFMNSNITQLSKLGSEEIEESVSPPKNIKIISVKSLSEVQNELNLPIFDSGSKQNTTILCLTTSSSQKQVKSSMETISEIGEGNTFGKNSIIHELLEAVRYITSETGFEGSELYVCPHCNVENIKCFTETDYNLHLISYHSKNTTFKCPHCTVEFGVMKNLCTHLLTHQKHRYFCYYCNNSAILEQNLMKHMLEEHARNYESLKTVAIVKEINTSVYNVVCPNQVTKEDILNYKSRLIRIAERKKSLIKTTYHSKELSFLPNQQIFNPEVVRTNMVRYLSRQLNNEDSNVPNSEPVNLLPCLNKNAKQVNKVINVPSSSNNNEQMLNAIVLNEEIKTNSIEANEKASYDINELKSKIPVFVEKNKLFVCGTTKCTYLTHRDYMLKCHIQTLHLDEKEYKCPHCTKILCKNGLNVDEIMEHYKFHDSLIIYVCNECTFMHYEKHFVENHIKKKHPMETIYLLTCKRSEEFISSSFADRAEANMSIVETQQQKLEVFNWKCSFCKYCTDTYQKMKKHINSEHDTRYRYSCTHCKFGGDICRSVTDHITENHPTKIQQVNCAFNLIDFPKTSSKSIGPLCDASQKKDIGEISLEKEYGTSIVQETESEEIANGKQDHNNTEFRKTSKSLEDNIMENQLSTYIEETETSSNQLHGINVKLDIYACFYCPFKNLSIKAVSNHWGRYHNKKTNDIVKPFMFHIFGYMSNESVECFQPNIDKNDLQRLLRIGQRTKRFQCNKCWKLFAEEDSVTAHQKTEHPECDKLRSLLFCFRTFYICNICEYGSLLEHKTAAHLLNHYELMKKCRLCSEYYENIIDFITHLSKHNLTLLEFLKIDEELFGFWNEMLILYGNGLCIRKKNLLDPNKDKNNVCLQNVVKEFSKIVSSDIDLPKTNTNSQLEPKSKQLKNIESSTSSIKLNSINTKLQYNNQDKKTKKRLKKSEKDCIWLPSAEKRKGIHQSSSSSSSSYTPSSSGSSDNENLSEPQGEKYKIPYNPPQRRKSMFVGLPALPVSLTRRASLYYENSNNQKCNFLGNIKEKQRRRPLPKCMQQFTCEQLIPYSFYGKKPDPLKLSELFTKSLENSETTITVEMFSLLTPINCFVLVEKLNPSLVRNKNQVDEQ